MIARGNNLDEALDTDGLRAGFLQYTRQAYALVPGRDRTRILDIGCGTGLPTIELARLGPGRVVGIDTDARALEKLRQRLQEAGAGLRVEAVKASLYDTAFAGEGFDLLWEEGVLHLLDPARSVPACHALLAPGGFLVMHETVSWFEGVWERLRGCGFALVDTLRLPPDAWWTDYYAPLASRIRALRKERGLAIDSEALARHEREIALVKPDPGRHACGFFVLENRISHCV